VTDDPERAAASDAGPHPALCDQLAERGFAIEGSFLPLADVAALRAEAQRRHAAGELRPARVGRGAGAQRAVSIRGDEIGWLDVASATPPERALLARFDALRLALNRALFLGLVELEAHYARYAPGAGYARHVDRFRDDDARVISLVLYLNEAWHPEDGGELRLFADAEAREPLRTIEPRGGTLVAMRAEAIHHEVALARRERWSVAGWLRRRP
jgi:SM-20-related protein